MSPRVLHVVVGAGNVHYFVNAVRSVLDLEAGDVFAAYNYVDEDDFLALEQRKRELYGISHLEVRANDSSLRTGSLYEANNAGLSFARGDYDFVSFMQADMQLMWWNPRIIQLSTRIVESLRTCRRISFYTQLPVLGKHPKPYDRWTWDERLGEFVSFGHVDVCLLPIYSGLNSEFSFTGTEQSLSDRANRDGSRIIFHPFPFIAPIPFPETVRDKKGPSRKRREFELPILSVVAGFSADFQRSSLHPVSMEEAVRPNGWACLYPYWPSDTQSGLWLSRRLEYAKLSGSSFFMVIGRRGKIHLSPTGDFVPGIWVFLMAIISGLTRELKIRSRKLFSSAKLKPSK